MSSISVIITCFKDVDTLERAINSVYTQTIAIDELIVVNDCSPESEEIDKIILSYNGIFYIKNSENIGLAASRNVGVRASKSEIICFLDADDELHPQKIEIQLENWRSDIALSCESLEVYSLKKTVFDSYSNEYTPIKIFRSPVDILMKNRITGAAIMISRQLLLDMNGYDESLRSCEDYDLWLRLLENGINVYKIELPLYFYFINKNGLSKNYLSISYWESEVVKKYFIRSEGEFLGTYASVKVWCWLMMKHIWRVEKSNNVELKMQTVKNINMLSDHPIIKTGLLFLVELRVMKCLRLFSKVDQ